MLDKRPRDKMTRRTVSPAFLSVENHETGSKMPTWFDKLPRSQYASLKRVFTQQTWFQVYSIRPTVFAIYEPHQCEEVISYLIIGPEKSLLIDTGMGIGNIQELVNELSSLPLIVVNTHTHHDHVGDNWRFEQSLIGVESKFSTKNEEDFRDDAQSEVQDDMIRLEYLPEGFDRSSYRIHPFRINKHIVDGDSIDLGGGRKISVIFTPGHTPDSISLLDLTERLLFVGDSFYEGPIFLYRPETNLGDYVRSLKKLVAIIEKNQVDLVVPSHNTPNAHPDLLRKALGAIEEVLTGGKKADGITNDSHHRFDFGEFSFVIDPRFLTK